MTGILTKRSNEPAAQQLMVAAQLELHDTLAGATSKASGRLSSSRS
jgi:hypothetical protein